MSDCGCSPLSGSQDLTIINTQNQIIIQTWYQLWVDALFDIDVAFPGTPDLFGSDPADVGDEVAQRDRALCLAVNSWVDELLNRGLSYAKEAGVAVAAAVSGGVALPSVPTWIVTAGLVGSAFALSELAVELASTPYRQYLICAMYEDLKAKDTNSPTAFAESWDNLPVRPPPPESIFQDIARDAIEAWGRSQLNNVDNYLAFIKSLNIAMGVASSLEVTDCGCLFWEHTFDFTIDEQGFTAFEGAFGGPRAFYDAGVGWGNFSAAGPWSHLIQLIGPAFVARHLLQLDFFVSIPLTAPGRLFSVRGPDVDAADFSEDVDPLLETEATILIGATSDGWWTSVFVDDGNSYQGHLTKLILSGTGTDPF